MLNTCQAGSPFKGVVLITEWKENSFRNKPGCYISMTCQDATGTMVAKIWETKDCHLNWLKEKDIFYVEATVNEFRGALELTIDVLQPMEEGDIDLGTLLPSSPLSEQELEERLFALVQLIQSEPLQRLVSSILTDPVLGSAFRKAPAAAKVHQAYLRGLMEHSVGVAELALSIGSNYPEVDRDLLLLGALFHDIGKILEYDYERGISVTTEGRLLGHIIMGVELLSRKMDENPDIPAELKNQLLHIIVSHHGQYEWQSPRRPKSMEALIIHHADVLDADLWQFRQAKEKQPQEEWSPFVRSMERYLYLK